jgi:hypothetical protein
MVVVVETAGSGKLIGLAKTFGVWAASLKQPADHVSVQIGVGSGEEISFLLGLSSELGVPVFSE